MSAIENLSVHHSLKRLQFHVLTHMTQNLLPQTIQLMDVFEAFDQDGDQTLSLQEFSKSVKSLKPSLTDLKIEAMFGRIDHNQDGQIQLEEFMVAACDKKLAINKEVLVLAFKHYDVNGYGKITRHDLKKPLADRGGYTKEYFQQSIAEFAEDNVKYITFP